MQTTKKVCLRTSDTMQPRLLQDLNLAPFFDVVLCSYIFGKAKPDGTIFREALQKLSVEPSEALHVGDHPLKDCQAAKVRTAYGENGKRKRDKWHAPVTSLQDVGMRSLLLVRRSETNQSNQISSLHLILKFLDSS
jgi:FMN phosphatase YigB (HAD superfamily)